jgi:hypothetical protein
MISNSNRFFPIAIIVAFSIVSSWPFTFGKVVGNQSLDTSDRNLPPLAGDISSVEPTPFPLQIFSPGEGSRVAAPIEIHAALNLENNPVFILELRGRDGRLLVRHLQRFGQVSETERSMALDLNFQIRDPEETARLLLISRDQYGRIAFVNSVDLVLLSGGEGLVTSMQSTTPHIQIQEPLRESVHQGGFVTVSGVSRSESDTSLRVQLVSEDGEIVGQRLAGLSPGADAGGQSFTTEVPYKVSETTPARLIVFEGGGAISEIRYLSSVELVLEP